MKYVKVRTRVVFGVGLVAGLSIHCGESDAVSGSSIGDRAIQLTRGITALGPRPPGSSGIKKAREKLQAEVKRIGYDLNRDSFMAETPLENIEMVNLSFRIPGSLSKERVLLVAHYDSKRFVGFDFVGANDAASSVALLVTLAPEIAKMRLSFDTEIFFVDGEEALVSWSPADSLYGSRYLAASLAGGKKVKGAIVVDMVGDKDLSLIDESTADPRLRSLLKEEARNLGKPDLVESRSSVIDDDHQPLIRAGIPTLHLMDFTYGGSSSPGIYWHTSQDTVDRISGESLGVVGDLVLRILARI